MAGEPVGAPHALPGGRARGGRARGHSHQQVPCVHPTQRHGILISVQVLCPRESRLRKTQSRPCQKEHKLCGLADAFSCSQHCSPCCMPPRCTVSLLLVLTTVPHLCGLVTALRPRSRVLPFQHWREEQNRPSLADLFPSAHPHLAAGFIDSGATYYVKLKGGRLSCSSEGELSVASASHLAPG